MSGRSAKRKDAIELIVPGLPVGKAYSHRRDGRLYLTPKTRKYQEAIVTYAFAIRFTSDWQPSKDVRATLIFEFATKDKRKIGKIKTTKPDADNLIKACLDGLRPLIGDDSKVTPRVLRRWSEESRTIVRLRNM